MQTADELFLQLGYTRNDEISKIVYYNNETDEYFCFLLEEHKVYSSDNSFGMRELEIINLKIKELGW